MYRLLTCLLSAWLLGWSLAALASDLDVRIEGVKGDMLTNIEARLDILKHANDEKLDERWIRRLHASAPEQIRRALQPFGYYRPRIEASLTREDGKWLARYRVDPGKPVRLGHIDIRWRGPGARAAALTRAIADFPLKAGDVLDHKRWEEGKEGLLDAAYLSGYAKARIVESRALVDPDAGRADATLLLETGPLYHFGQVQVHQDFLDDELVAAYNTLKEGAVYSHDELLRYQQGLIASGYSQSVTLEPRFDLTRDSRVPIDVTMTPAKKHKFSFGLGFETSIGPRFTAQWDDRRINRRGHQSSVYLKLAQKERELRGIYRIPVVDPRTDRLEIGARYHYEETPTTTSTTLTPELAFVRRNLEDTLFMKGFVNYQLERFTIEGDPERSTKLLQFGFISRYSKVESAVFPRRGRYAYGEIRGASSFLLSDTSFARLLLKGRYLLPLGARGRLDINLELGASWVEDFDLYPSSLRFFAGGDGSVRGYSYKELGPRDDKNIVIGGQHLLTLNLEYDHRVAKSWAVAAFVDAGNAFASDDLGKLFVGAGFGVRWLAPFGALKIDLGWPVSENATLGDAQLYIGFGATL